MTRSISVRRILAAAYAGAILWSACLPRAADGAGTAALSAGRNLLHVPLYAGLAILLSWAFQESFGERTDSSMVPARVLLAVAACAVADEGLQSIAVGRSASSGDLLLDLSGAAIALLLIRFRSRTEARA